MINFFRSIRRILLNDNKTGKYLTYAIGEILLVVIGILIALSLNNWNDNQKNNREEILILNSLLDNLQLAKAQSEYNIEDEEILVSSLLFLLNYDSKSFNSINSELMDSVFYDGIWSLETDIPIFNSYADLKNTGKIGLIKNKDLRDGFTFLEESLARLTELVADRLSTHQLRIDHIAENEINFVHLSKHKIPGLNTENEIPNDYNSILQNKRIRNLLTIKLKMSQDILDKNKDLEWEIDELIESIKSELNLEEK